jgi:hypothetical protein
MIRYFEVKDKRQTLKLTLEPPASYASPKELSKELKMELRELNKRDYDRLSKEYSK